MAEQQEFKFPDEQEAEAPAQKEEDKFEIQIEDDTPPQDRGRTPLPKKVVEELENDDLEE